MADIIDKILDLIEQFESEGKNVRNQEYGPGKTAQGYWQITNQNWRKLAPKLGISIRRHPNAMSASRDDQKKVARELYVNEGGLKNWLATRKAKFKEQYDKLIAQERPAMAPAAVAAAVNRALPAVKAPPRVSESTTPMGSAAPQIDPRTGFSRGDPGPLRGYTELTSQGLTEGMGPGHPASTIPGYPGQKIQSGAGTFTTPEQAPRPPMGPKAPIGQVSPPSTGPTVVHADDTGKQPTNKAEAIEYLKKHINEYPPEIQKEMRDLIPKPTASKDAGFLERYAMAPNNWIDELSLGGADTMKSAIRGWKGLPNPETGQVDKLGEFTRAGTGFANTALTLAPFGLEAKGVLSGAAAASNVPRLTNFLTSFAGGGLGELGANAIADWADLPPEGRNALELIAGTAGAVLGGAGGSFMRKPNVGTRATGLLKLVKPTWGTRLEGAREFFTGEKATPKSGGGAAPSAAKGTAEVKKPPVSLKEAERDFKARSIDEERFKRHAQEHGLSDSMADARLNTIKTEMAEEQRAEFDKAAKEQAQAKDKFDKEQERRQKEAEDRFKENRREQERIQKEQQRKEEKAKKDREDATEEAMLAATPVMVPKVAPSAPPVKVAPPPGVNIQPRGTPAPTPQPTPGATPGGAPTQPVQPPQPLRPPIMGQTAPAQNVAPPPGPSIGVRAPGLGQPDLVTKPVETAAPKVPETPGTIAKIALTKRIDLSKEKISGQRARADLANKLGLPPQWVPSKDEYQQAIKLMANFETKP